MKKNLFILLLTLVLCFSLTACKKPNSLDSSFAVDDIVSNGIQLNLKKLSKVNNTELYRISATVYPSYATNKTLKWSYAFKKDELPQEAVLDYISLNISSNTLYCDIVCIAPFNVPIYIYAESETDSTIFGMCTLYYLSRVDEDSVTIDFDLELNGHYFSLGQDEDNVFIYEDSNYSQIFVESLKFSSAVVEYDLYGTTNPVDYVDCYYVQLSEDLINLLDFYSKDYDFVYDSARVPLTYFTESTLCTPSIHDMLFTFIDIEEDMLLHFFNSRECKTWFKFTYEVCFDYSNGLTSFYSTEFYLASLEIGNIPVSNVVFDKNDLYF